MYCFGSQPSVVAVLALNLCINLFLTWHANQKRFPVQWQGTACRSWQPSGKMHVAGARNALSERGSHERRDT